MIHTIFSSNGYPYYHGWQDQLLVYTHARVHQPGEITRLLSSDVERPPLPGAATFQTPSYAFHKALGDDYSAYNKPHSVYDWLFTVDEGEETILVLDPDCVFLAPVTREASRGTAFAQPIRYLSGTARPENKQLAQYFGVKPEEVQGVGSTFLIHVEDLRAISPHWLEYTYGIRTHPVFREQTGWVSEMYAYVLAAARVGVRHEEYALCSFQGDDHVECPLIHYAFESKSFDGSWEWTKRNYVAWTPIPDPPHAGAPGSALALHELLVEYAALQEFKPI